jgi:hypothetical protein
MKPKLTAPGTLGLKLYYGNLLSSFAFNLSLRRYIKSRQQSYIRREGRYKEQIEELQATAERATASRTTSDGSSALQRNGVYALHQKVLASVNGVVETAEMKQKAAEKDAMQTFRARQGTYSYWY